MGGEIKFHWNTCRKMMEQVKGEEGLEVPDVEFVQRVRVNCS